MMIMLSLMLAVATPSISEAKQAIADSTANPSAVQFKNIREGDGVVCGEFNAQNRLGGYNGFEPFVYESKTMWGTGLLDGLVMHNGEPVRITMSADPRLDQAKITSAMHDYRMILRRCPKA